VKNLIIYTLLIIGSININLNAQTAIGGRLGLSFISYDHSQAIEFFKAKQIMALSPQYALLVFNPHSNNRLTFQQELLLSEKGATYLWKYDSLENKDKIRESYVDMPFLVKYTFGKTVAKLKFFINCGLYVGYQLKYKYYDFFNNICYSDLTNYSLIERLDFGNIIGAGLTYKFWKGEFVAEIRYTDSYYLNGDNVGIRYRSDYRLVGLNAGYMFKMGTDKKTKSDNINAALIN